MREAAEGIGNGAEDIFSGGLTELKGAEVRVILWNGTQGDPSCPVSFYCRANSIPRDGGCRV